MVSVVQWGALLQLNPLLLVLSQASFIHCQAPFIFPSFLARALKGLPFSFFISHSVFVCICIPSSSFALCLFLRCQKFATLLPKRKGVEAIHSLPPLTSPLLSAPFYFAIFQYAPYQPTIRPRHLPQTHYQCQMRVHHPQPKVEFLPTPPNTNFDDDGDDCSSRGGSGNSFFAPPSLPPQALELPIPHIQKSPPPFPIHPPPQGVRERESEVILRINITAGREGM